MSRRDLDALYESLARYQWWRRRVGRAADDHALAMHKRLEAPRGEGPGAGVGPLNRWLFERVGVPAHARVLDVGCGFGATLLDWAARTNLTGLGITPSPYQVAKARGEAARRGLADRLDFAARGYDTPFEPRFDVVVAIESLAHARDLAATLRGLADALDPAGALAVVEDMATEDLADDDDASDLAAHWASSAPHPTEGAFRAAIADAGLRLRADIDLTDQVPDRGDAARAASRRRLERLRRFVPPGGPRRVLDAFLGGLALERLYAKGRMRYRTFIADARKRSAGA